MRPKTGWKLAVEIIMGREAINVYDRRTDGDPFPKGSTGRDLSNMSLPTGEIRLRVRTRAVSGLPDLIFRSLLFWTFSTFRGWLPSHPLVCASMSNMFIGEENDSQHKFLERFPASLQENRKQFLCFWKKIRAALGRHK